MLFDCIDSLSLPALLFSYTELYMYVQRITYADAVHPVTSWSNGKTGISSLKQDKKIFLKIFEGTSPTDMGIITSKFKNCKTCPIFYCLYL